MILMDRMAIEPSYSFACPQCGQHLSATAELAGSVTGCPVCSTSFTVPFPASPASSLPPPVSPTWNHPKPKIWSQRATWLCSLLLAMPLGPAMQGLNWKASGRPVDASKSFAWAWSFLATDVVLTVVGAFVDSLQGMLHYVVLMLGLRILLVLVWLFVDGLKQGRYFRTLSPGSTGRRSILGPIGIWLACFVVASVIGSGIRGIRQEFRSASPRVVIQQTDHRPAPSVRSVDARGTPQDPETESPREQGTTPTEADILHGSLITRSGAKTIEEAITYYSKVSPFKSGIYSPEKLTKGDVVQMIQGWKVIQVGRDFISLRHMQNSIEPTWIVRLDNPKAINDLAIYEGSLLMEVVGVYAGNTPMTDANGIISRVPTLVAMAISTPESFYNVENPEAKFADAATMAQVRSEVEGARLIKALNETKQREENRLSEQRRHEEYRKAEMDRQSAIAANVKPEPRDVRPKAEQLASARKSLAEMESAIIGDQEAWNAANAQINKLTNFRRTPVQEGTQAYYQCVAASKTIKEVEANTPKLKAEKARLEELIKNLEADGK